MTPARTLKSIFWGSNSSGANRDVWDGLSSESGTTLERNAKVPFFLLFYDVFLKVPPLTKSAAGQRLRIPGSNPGLANQPKGLYQHRQDPTS